MFINLIHITSYIYDGAEPKKKNGNRAKSSLLDKYVFDWKEKLGSDHGGP